MTTPRWYTALQQAVAQHSNSSLFQLATVDDAGKPCIRSLIHRAFLVPPSRPAFPIFVTSTDIRSAKVRQIAHADTVELVWWINATLDQFRISGLARVFASPQRSIPHTAVECGGINALEMSGVDWEAKRRELFDAVSEEMRASWCRPAGMPLKVGEENDWPTTVPKPNEAKTDREKELAELALSNYAIIAIDPLRVDWVQLGTKPYQRTFFNRTEDGWSEEAIVP
ncbi:pyridoxamine 5'-phosphate oxidase-domain-containing protein [Lactarius akahatsu]|uniref:Pyridoxamine 5'-phosphate oxidase-domain-containing protein n=1 Tax=Lactarius akahatsu TaxID=416441 RepID=A0AAD4LHQ8_9AGAM|nr:pyridoxamine 5'-phosphate oxidase-domain-containing protein [Lactarius akahatsu]